MKEEGQLLGICHVTATTSDAEKNYHFFTDTLGMRLVKKTVSQDDICTCHTRFAGDSGTLGTTMTFLDLPNNPKGLKGTNIVSRTGFQVPSDTALTHYESRFNEFAVKHTGTSEEFEEEVLRFWDPDD